MPVYKYKSLEQAEMHLKELLPKDTAEKLQRVQTILHELKGEEKCISGVHKFKSLQEAQEQRKNSRSAG